MQKESQFNLIAQTAPTVQPNTKMLAVLNEIALRQQGRAESDGSDTLRLIKEARSGAMYDYDPAE